MASGETVGGKRDSITVLVSPTQSCNLSCRYCFVSKYGVKEVMGAGVLEEVVRQVADFVRRPRFLWHGGEPLLAGIGFYEEVLEIQKKYFRDGLCFNGLQTNGTLLDEEYAKFFIENDFSLSVSLDYPEYVHNSNRVTPDGMGTFKKAYTAIRMLKEMGGKVRALSVITSLNHDKAAEIYDFMARDRIDFKTNAISPNAEYRLRITPIEFGNFLIQLFDAWNNDVDRVITIKNFHKIISALKTGRPSLCTFNESCGKRICGIGSDGSVYPCFRSEQTEHYKEGSIFEKKLSEFFKSGLKPWDRNLSGLECSYCKWLTICYGGCSYYAYLNGRSFDSRDYYCKAYKMISEHINEALDLGW